jgi:hypothetical protein
VPLLYCGDWNSEPPVSSIDNGVTVPGMPVVFWALVMAYNWIRSRIWGEPPRHRHRLPGYGGRPRGAQRSAEDRGTDGGPGAANFGENRTRERPGPGEVAGPFAGNGGGEMEGGATRGQTGATPVLSRANSVNRQRLGAVDLELRGAGCSACNSPARNAAHELDSGALPFSAKGAWMGSDRERFLGGRRTARWHGRLWICRFLSALLWTPRSWPANQ